MEKFEFRCKCKEDTILINCSIFKYEQLIRAVLTLGAIYQNGEYIISDREKYKKLYMILSKLG